MTAADGLQCLGCGACCATFRVSFYWAEAAALDESMVEQLTPTMACMAGTNRHQPRCVGLQGQVGVDARCSLYADRPPPCHELQAGEPKCLKARARHGLP